VCLTLHVHLHHQQDSRVLVLLSQLSVCPLNAPNYSAERYPGHQLTPGSQTRLTLVVEVQMVGRLGRLQGVEGVEPWMLLRLLPLMLREQPLLWLQRQTLQTLQQQVPG
jgi:hypothetical protein